jgi:hypothetical protein
MKYVNDVMLHIYTKRHTSIPHHVKVMWEFFYGNMKDVVKLYKKI